MGLVALQSHLIGTRTLNLQPNKHLKKLLQPQVALRRGEPVLPCSEYILLILEFDMALYFHVIIFVNFCIMAEKWPCLIFGYLIC